MQAEIQFLLSHLWILTFFYTKTILVEIRSKTLADTCQNKLVNFWVISTVENLHILSPCKVKTANRASYFFVLNWWHFLAILCYFETISTQGFFPLESDGKVGRVFEGGISTNSKKIHFCSHLAPFLLAFLRISKLQYSFSLENKGRGIFFLAKLRQCKKNLILKKKIKEDKRFFTVCLNSNQILQLVYKLFPQVTYRNCMVSIEKGFAIHTCK